MLNIAPFITPLSHSPNPTGAVGNALHARGLEYSNNNEKARLAEQKNEFGQRQALDNRQQDFRESTDARDFQQHRDELHTKLIEWGTSVLDKEGAEKARQIVGPVWEAAGIGVDFGDGPNQKDLGAMAAPSVRGAAPEDDEMADLEAAQKERGDLAEYAPGASSTGPKPGESFSAYVSRNTAKLGNIDTANRPKVKNQDGSTSTVRSIGVNIDGKEVLLPTVSEDGRVMTDDEAIAQYKKTGRNLGKFDTQEESDAAAQALHEQQGSQLEASGGEEPGQPPTTSPGRQWKIIDKTTGRVLGTIDPDRIRGANKSRAAERAAAYASGTPEARRPIVEGFTSSAENPAEVELGMGHAERAIGELEKTDRTIKNHKGGGVGGPSDPFASKLASTANDDMLQYVSKAVTNSGAPKLNQAANDGMKVADLASSPVALEQKVAAGQMLKSLFGAAASEGERAFVFGSEGEFQRLQQAANNWLEGGQMPEGFKAALQHAANRMAELARKKAAAIADKAAEDALNSPLLGGRLGAMDPETRAKVKAPLVNVGRVETSGAEGNANEEASKLGF